MRCVTLVLAVALALPSLSTPGELPRLATLAPSSPCGFFRDRAWGKGLDPHATAMLWACEAIALRRGAGLTLGERLEAVDRALGRYRAAVVASDAGDDASVARASGALDAIDAIDGGF